MKLRLLIPTVGLLCLALPATLFGQYRSLSDGKIAFTTASCPWELLLNGKHFTVEDQKPSNGGRYFLMRNDVDHITASLWIEPVDQCRTSKECRDMVLRLGNSAWGKYQDLVKAQIGDTSYFEFYRPSVLNQPLKMLDMYAEFVHQGYWVDLHLSKVLYTKADHVLFEKLVKSATFVSKMQLGISHGTESCLSPHMAVYIPTGSIEGLLSTHQERPVLVVID